MHQKIDSSRIAEVLNKLSSELQSISQGMPTLLETQNL